MNPQLTEKMSTRREIISRSLQSICNSNFKTHPFSTLTDENDLEKILGNYLAMSQAFPFLQAGAQKELIFNVLMCGEDVPQDYEITASIMNFLCWDETGGHNATLRHGNEGLPKILETNNRFHANILRNDLEKLFSKKVKPIYSLLTRKYLISLYNRLSTLDSVQRVGAMVAFERHAQQMIEALWLSLSRVLKLDKEELLYFKIHVGGNDPAEAYHVEMTFQMIEKIVKLENENLFYRTFTDCYALNYNWCRDLLGAGRGKKVRKRVAVKKCKKV